MPSTTRERLEGAVKQLQDFADEVDKKGVQTGEDTEKLTKMAVDVMTIKGQFEAESKAAGTLTDAKAFLANLAQPADGQLDAAAQLQASKSLTMAGLPMNPQGKTFGELFVESEQFGEFRKRYGGRDGVIPDSTKGIQSPTFFGGADLKTLITGTSRTSGGAFITNDRQPGVTDLVGERELTIADLVTKGTTESDTIEYVRITGKTNNAAPVAEATSSGQPAVYNAPTAGELTAGGYKPESGLALAVVTTTVRTLAHWVPITKRAATDAGQIRTLVDEFLAYGLNEKLEDQILKGDGTGQNFTGILNSGILSVAGTAGAAGDIDDVVAGIRTVRVSGRRRPDAIVMHPNDWYSTGFLMAKDNNGNYLIGDPRASLDQLNQLWGLRVVISEAANQGTALVGAFRFGVLWQREGITLSVTDSHLDFFTRNLLAILAEMRAAFGVLDSEAFCTVGAL